MDETYIIVWSDESINGLFVPISNGQRVNTVHAGGEDVFVVGAHLHLKSHLTTGNHDSAKDYEQYKKWLKSQFPVIPRKVSW
jgi:hypothetical protein